MQQQYCLFKQAEWNVMLHQQSPISLNAACLSQLSTHHIVLSLARQPLLLKKGERVWGIVHIRHIPIKEFPNTSQLAERMNVHCKM